MKKQRKRREMPPRRPPGRPKTADGERLHSIRVMLHAHEKEAIIDNAGGAGKAGGYLRELGLRGGSPGSSCSLTKCQ